MPPEQAPSPRFFWNQCLTYAENTSVATGPCARSTYAEDFQHPLDEAIAQFFLACRFNGISVALDSNNYFVRSRFEGVTFKYTGKIPFASNNVYLNCRVEIPEGVALPRGSEIFDHCETTRVKTVILDNDTIGRPTKWEKVGTQIVLPIR